jgi:hypothetical protein
MDMEYSMENDYDYSFNIDIDCSNEDFIDYCEFIDSHRDERDRIENPEIEKVINLKCSDCGSEIYIKNKGNDNIFKCGREEINNVTVRRCLEKDIV